MSRGLKGFSINQAWVVARSHMPLSIKDKPFDTYFLIEAVSSYVFGTILLQEEFPSSQQVSDILEKAFRLKNIYPKQLLFPKGDPAQKIFFKEAQKRNIELIEVPKSDLEEIASPVINSFEDFMIKGKKLNKSFQDENEIERLKIKAAHDFVPDSYDPCSCASQKKFKFCCKLIYMEIIQAIACAQENNLEKALNFMKKAEAKIGKTAEILCRYAVVYSYFDTQKSNEYLNECLKNFPNHPRANYIQGIRLKEENDLEGAVRAYQAAIDNYPKTDKYHLNEALTNLGVVYYDLGKYSEAKEAWEKALVYIPYDRVTRQNLKEFIYENPILPETLRSMSPFIKKIYESTESLNL